MAAELTYDWQRVISRDPAGDFVELTFLGPDSDYPVSITKADSTVLSFTLTISTGTGVITFTAPFLSPVTFINDTEQLTILVV